MSQRFQAVQREPMTNAELNIKTARADMSVNDQELYRKIKAGKFTTVYYIEGDEQRAVEKFVGVNYEQISDLPEMSRKLYTDLPTEIVRMIKDEFARMKKLRVRASQFLFVAIQAQDADNEGAILCDPRYEMVSIDPDDNELYDE